MENSEYSDFFKLANKSHCNKAIIQYGNFRRFKLQYATTDNLQQAYELWVQVKHNEKTEAHDTTKLSNQATSYFLEDILTGLTFSPPSSSSLVEPKITTSFNNGGTVMTDLLTQQNDGFKRNGAVH